jgi:hypothetical protein
MLRFLKYVTHDDDVRNDVFSISIYDKLFIMYAPLGRNVARRFVMLSRGSTTPRPAVVQFVACQNAEYSYCTLHVSP